MLTIVECATSEIRWSHNNNGDAAFYREWVACTVCS